jgi:dihydroxyacetone kinase-like protein
MGTLLATGLLRAGQAVLGRAGLDLAGLAQMLEAFVEGISARGKAKPGDKTILDSLYPALEALRGACEQQLSLVDGVAAAYQAAVQGLAATKEMVSQHGKAACFGERTLGRQDPGATVGAYICEALLATVQDGEGLG